MRNKKITFILLALTFVLSLVFSSVSANELEIGDFYAKTDTYSFSEDSEDIYMPFMRFSTSTINVDKEINNIGAIFSNKGIEVKKEIKKTVALFSQDTIRVDEKISDAAIFSTTNVIVDKGSNGTLIIFAVGDVTIGEDAIITGDLICFSTNVNIKGKIEGNVLGACNKFELTGTIAKDLRMEIEDISINEDNKVLGKLYLETIGENSKVESLKSIYPNLINKIIEANKIENVGIKTKIISNVMPIIITVLVSWLVFLIITKASKTNMLERNLKKVIKYRTPVILIGAFSLVAIPIVLILLILLIAFGLYVVAVPALVIYIAFIIIGISSSVLVIGSLVSTYILSKVDVKEKTYLKILIPLGVFLVIAILPKVPFISGFIGIAYVMATVGILTVCMFKRVETEENK